MKSLKIFFFLMLVLLLPVSSFAAPSDFPDADPGWPRIFKANGKELIIYQPQVDAWTDYKILYGRCAVSVKTGPAAKEKFGVAEFETETVVDHENRVVALIPRTRTLRFPNIPDSESNWLRQTVDELYPQGRAMTVSLDRILAYLDPEKQQQQHAVELNLDPPKIFFSTQPAILVMFMGEPQLQPVVENQNDLMFAVNANWPVFFDTASQRYYLLNGDNWLMTDDVLKGTWTPAGTLPQSFFSFPGDDNWADVRAQIPGKPVSSIPLVFSSTEPAELILTQGQPSFSPVRGTKLMRIVNTEATVFFFADDKSYYLLTAGRWFRAGGLDGPWSAASKNLPGDFARIPDDDPAAYVKASVPGTIEAKDAVLLASIPTQTVMTVADAPVVEVRYDGEPKFQVIEKTTIQYAINSPNAVFLVDNRYYCCNSGVWYVSQIATGQWTLCSSVPSVIYTIPPSHPMHNVTYVVVQNSTPTTVVYAQTAGYSGQYVAATGVLMFGAGMLAGAMITNSHHHHHYPSYPVHYSYGWGARYDYYRGGYYRAAHTAYGPYAGGGAGAVYNPKTGIYSRAAYAYGPRGSVAVRQTYDSYTGTRSSSGRVDTAYGSAGRGVAYNPSTGNAARGGYRTDARGTAAAVQTNKGTGAAAVKSNNGAAAGAWNTKYGQGAAARDKQGNVYAGKDGKVYKKDTSGNWSSNTGSGWQKTSKPTATRELNAQAGARARGDQMQKRGREK